MEQPSTPPRPPRPSADVLTYTPPTAHLEQPTTLPYRNAQTQTSAFAVEDIQIAEQHTQALQHFIAEADKEVQQRSIQRKRREQILFTTMHTEPIAIYEESQAQKGPTQYNDPSPSQIESQVERSSHPVPDAQTSDQLEEASLPIFNGQRGAVIKQTSLPILDGHGGSQVVGSREASSPSVQQLPPSPTIDDMPTLSQMDNYLRLSEQQGEVRILQKPNAKASGGRGRFKKRQSKAEKAGLTFPVTRIQNKIRLHRVAKRVSPGSAVYMAAILEYIAAEILELSGNACQDARKKRITPRHIMLAVRHDAELNELIDSKVHFACGGVVPHIHSVLKPLPNRRG